MSTPVGELSDASRRGRRSRTKGRVFERAVAKLLRDVYGQHIRRGWQSRSGREGCDVEGSRWWLELKHAKLVNLRAALKQASEDTDGRPVAIIAKDDRTEPVVLVKLADWLERERLIVQLQATLAGGVP